MEHIFETVYPEYKEFKEKTFKEFNIDGNLYPRKNTKIWSIYCNTSLMTPSLIKIFKQKTYIDNRILNININGVIYKLHKKDNKNIFVEDNGYFDIPKNIFIDFLELFNLEKINIFHYRCLQNNLIDNYGNYYYEFNEKKIFCLYNNLTYTKNNSFFNFFVLLKYPEINLRCYTDKKTIDYIHNKLSIFYESEKYLNLIKYIENNYVNFSGNTLEHKFSLLNDGYLDFKCRIFLDNSFDYRICEMKKLKNFEIYCDINKMKNNLREKFLAVTKIENKELGTSTIIKIRYIEIDNKKIYLSTKNPSRIFEGKRISCSYTDNIGFFYIRGRDLLIKFFNKFNMNINESFFIKDTNLGMIDNFHNRCFFIKNQIKYYLENNCSKCLMKVYSMMFRNISTKYQYYIKKSGINNENFEENIEEKYKRLFIVRQYEKSKLLIENLNNKFNETNIKARIKEKENFLLIQQLDDLKTQLRQKDSELEEKNKILKKLLTTI